jgi:hypothetical protein
MAMPVRDDRSIGCLLPPRGAVTSRLEIAQVPAR